MISYFEALLRGWKILIKNYIDVVDDIEKQTSELSKLQTPENRAGVYDYLQRLVKLHLDLFSTTWTAIIAIFSLIISIIALFFSLK